MAKYIVAFYTIKNNEVEELDYPIYNKKLFDFLINEATYQDKLKAHKASTLIFEDEIPFEDFIWGINNNIGNEVVTEITKDIIDYMKNNNFMINEATISEMEDCHRFNYEVWAIVDKI